MRLVWYVARRGWMHMNTVDRPSVLAMLLPSAISLLLAVMPTSSSRIRDPGGNEL